MTSLIQSIYYVEIWDKNRYVSYTREVSGKITFDGFYMPGGHNFPDYMRNLISRWKYNSKEVQTTGGVNWLDYGAREYDEVIAIWTRLNI